MNGSQEEYFREGESCIQWNKKNKKLVICDGKYHMSSLIMCNLKNKTKTDFYIPESNTILCIKYTPIKIKTKN